MALVAPIPAVSLETPAPPLPPRSSTYFAADHIIKAGPVSKRTRKTKHWHSAHLVLRPHELSVYRSEAENKLRVKIYTSEITAVAALSDPKKTRQHIFGVFSPGRNLHLQAETADDAERWIKLIRAQARIDEDAPPATGNRIPSHEYSGLSGAELASHDELSDVEIPVTVPFPAPLDAHPVSIPTRESPDRVLWHGWLWFLRSKHGVRQWKNMWAVVRPRNLILYGDETEYSARLVLPFPTIVDAVDIDPVSRSKSFCLQVITDERSYRFCAHDEEALVQVLGALKSLLAKRRELEREKE